MAKPLDGIRVIEMGQLLAGPFAGCLLAYFGAEVIKIEPPEGGDPLRGWRQLDESGTSFWWRSLARNKKSVTLDLRQPEGQSLAAKLIDGADVLVENFRPGVMEKWGLSPESVKARNPSLVYARISGFGQTGPYAHKPGFASVCEGMSGFRYVNGFPDQAPVRPNLSIGDTIAGLHAAFGIALALLAQKQTGQGQVVDVSLVESMFNLMEGIVPEFSGAGVIREPAGTTVTGIVPTNTYRCNNGKYVVIGGNGDSIFKRLMMAIGRADMANNPAMENNAGRVKHQIDIDNAIAAWCLANSSDFVMTHLETERVPVGPIYNVADQFSDPHFQARGLFERVEVDGKPLDIPALMPKLMQTPGATQWPGGAIGSHNDAVLGNILGLSEQDMVRLKAQGVIG